MELQRTFSLPDRSFFLFGPRGVGKSFLLRRILRADITFDLLDTRLQLELTRDPHELEAMIGVRKARSWIWIDEVQKVPRLLDEVHRLMETRRWRFSLSGSSARKLHRQGANLLAGRASTRYLEALTWKELLPLKPSIERLLLTGTLPQVILEPKAQTEILSAYVQTYIREEIKEEGLVRRLDPFLRFLDVMGLLNGQMINMSAIARDAQVPRRSVEGYIDILVDTLVAHRLPAYQPGAKVREVGHPKFYWFDPGVARAAARRLSEPLDEISRGVALETLLFHELRAYLRHQQRDHTIAYHRTGAGVEIDFVVETKRKTMSAPAEVVCIEVKCSQRWNAAWEKPMRSLAESKQVRVKKMFGVYLGPRRLQHGDVTVLPWSEFVERLSEGKVL